MKAADSKQPATIAALSGARAIPPLLIVLYHFSEGHHYSGVPTLDLIAAHGYLWVEFFFALSGFILTHVYGPRLAELWRANGYVGFLTARLIRLYPLDLFMLLALALLYAGVETAAHAGGYLSYYDARYHPDMSFKGFVLSLLLVHGWGTLSTLTWNGASWFVSVEFALCLGFPLLLWCATGRFWRGIGLTLAGMGGLLFLIAHSRHGLDITFDGGLARGICDFTVGAGLAAIYRAVAPVLRAAPLWVHGVAQALALAALLYALTRMGWSHTPNDIFTALAMFAFIFVLAFDKGWLAQALHARPFQHLGEWSYAIYLGQTFWLQSMRVIAQRFYPAPDAIVLGQRFSTLLWWLEPTLLILVCAVWGAALAEGIEKPAARFLRQHLAGWPRRLDRARAAAPSSGIT